MVDSSPQGAPGADGDLESPPVTICCASPDQEVVQSTSAALGARGYLVQIAIGVEADFGLLTEAVEKMSGQGLFVLCRSHALDRTAIDQLREILRNYDVPFGRTLTLPVDDQRPRDLEERIVSVLRRMVTGRPDGRPKSWGSSLPPADEEPDTTIRQPALVPGETTGPDLPLGLGLDSFSENADPFAHTSQIEFGRGDRGTDAGTSPEAYSGADRTSVAPAPTAPEGSRAPALDVPPAVGAEGSAPSSYGPASMPTFPSAELDSDDGPSYGEGSSAPVMAPGMPGAPHVVPGQVPSATPADDGEFEPPLTFGGRVGRALASPSGLAAVLGVTVLVVLAIVVPMALGDDEDDEPTTTASADVKDGEARSKETADEAKDDEPAKAADDADPAGDGAPTSDGTPRADDDPEPVAGIAGGVFPYIPGDPPPPVPERVTLSASDDPPEVAKALRDREVRALDIFLVAPERAGTLSYDRAVAYCRELDVAGLAGWRVPSIGEINAVSSARMLGKAIYWSATPADIFGDTIVVLNTKKERFSTVTKDWDGAKIVCVRLRQP